MNKILAVLIFIIAFTIHSNAQKTTNPVIYTVGVPGSCINGRVYVNVSTGFVYTYKTGVGCFLAGFAGGTITSPILGPNGSAANPTYANSTGVSGLYFQTLVPSISTNGVLKFEVNTAQTYSYNNTFSLGSAADVVFSRNASGVLALSDASGTNFGRIQLGGNTSSFPSIKRSSAAIHFRLADDTDYTGIAASTGTFSGAISTTTITASQLNIGTAGIVAPSGNNIFLRDNAGTGAGFVIWGNAATSAFPAIKRNGAAINFRLADDSADAAITTANITASNDVTTTGMMQVGAGQKFSFATSTRLYANGDGGLIIRSANDTIRVSTDTNGIVTTYNSIATTGNGVPSIHGSVILNNQTASIGTTTAYAVPAAQGGLYRVCWSYLVQQAATTSSSILVTIGWNTNAAKSTTLFSANGGAYQTTADTSNTVGASGGNCIPITASSSTNITYATTYASSGGTVMQYGLRVSVERLQ